MSIIINKQKAKKIIINNLQLMQNIKLISDNLVVNHNQPIERYAFDSNNYNSNISKPNLDSLLQFSGRESNGRYLPNIENPAVNNNFSNIIIRDDFGNISLDYNVYKESILPLIFITKTVAEWSDERLDKLGIKNISIDVHNSFSRGVLFEQIPGGKWKLKNKLYALIELVLIRNAFTHRGNVLEFEQKGNREILEVFNNLLPITNLQKGGNLLDIPYSKYIELFDSVISELS